MRLWQTRFQVIKALESLPMPSEVVYEQQEQPTYHIEEGRRRAGFCAQIACTIEGEGAFRLGKQVYRLTPGCAFMACHGDPDIAYYYPGQGMKPWRFLWMAFTGAQAVKIIREMNERYGYVFELPLTKGFVKHLESYEKQRDTFQIVTPGEGAKIVHDALAAFCEIVEGNLSTSPQAKLTRMAQEMISSNLDRAMDMSLIAEELNVTREHLSRVFHSQTGMSPGAFATGERMRAAARMLNDNRFSCKEIGARLGYNSPSSFARAFKTFFSMSPIEYKEHGLPPQESHMEIAEEHEPHSFPPFHFTDEMSGCTSPDSFCCDPCQPWNKE